MSVRLPSTTVRAAARFDRRRSAYSSAFTVITGSEIAAAWLAVVIRALVAASGHREEQVNEVHSAGVSRGSSGKRGLVAVLAILGVLAVVAGILYVSKTANSLHFMVGSVHHGYHQARAAVSFAVGIVLLVAAWIVARRR